MGKRGRKDGGKREIKNRKERAIRSLEGKEKKQANCGEKEMNEERQSISQRRRDRKKLRE